MRTTRLVGAAAVVGLLGLAPVPGADAAPNVVAAVNSMYAPAEVVIAAGTGLTFVNFDLSSHDVVAEHNEFASATIDRGATKVVGVESLAPNTYGFTCTVHPEMFGNLTVVG